MWGANPFRPESVTDRWPRLPRRWRVWEEVVFGLFVVINEYQGGEMKTKSIFAGLVLVSSLVCGGSQASVITGNAVQSISGIESTVHAYDQATVNLIGGADVAWLYMHQQSSLNFFAGDASWIHMHDSSEAEISGGDLSWLLMFDSSAANIYKSDISWLVMGGDSIAHIYGSNFSYFGSHLSGNWADGTPFSFWAVNGNAQGMALPAIGVSMPANIVLHAVPVPATLYLIGLALPVLAWVRGGLRAKPTPRDLVALS